MLLACHARQPSGQAARMRPASSGDPVSAKTQAPEPVMRAGTYRSSHSITAAISGNSLQATGCKSFRVVREAKSVILMLLVFLVKSEAAKISLVGTSIDGA